MQNWWECECTHAHSRNVYAVVDFEIVFLSLFRDNLATFCSTAVLQFFALPSSAPTYLGPDFPLLTEIQIPIHRAVYFSAFHNENSTVSIHSISWGSLHPQIEYTPLPFNREEHESSTGINNGNSYIHQTPHKKVNQ